MTHLQLILPISSLGVRYSSPPHLPPASLNQPYFSFSSSQPLQPHFLTRLKPTIPIVHLPIYTSPPNLSQFHISTLRLLHSSCPFSTPTYLLEADDLFWRFMSLTPGHPWPQVTLDPRSPSTPGHPLTSSSPLNSGHPWPQVTLDPRSHPWPHVTFDLRSPLTQITLDTDHPWSCQKLCTHLHQGAPRRGVVYHVFMALDKLLSCYPVVVYQVSCCLPCVQVSSSLLCVQVSSSSLPGVQVSSSLPCPGIQ